jgi:CRP-like cAMP-binding protein
MSDILHSVARTSTAPMMFAVLPPGIQDQLRKLSPLRTFSDDQIIQQRGETAKGFWLIAEGSVAIGQFLPHGEFRGGALLGPGDSWGELAMFAGRPRVVDAISRGKSLVRHIGERDFYSVLDENPESMHDLLASLSWQMQQLIDVVSGIRSGSAVPRIAGMLLTLAGEAGRATRIAITQQELGEQLGLTRATVNAALREFEREGAIRRSYGAIEVLDHSKLQIASLD